MDPKISSELEELIAEDDRVREELARDGSLFDGYHPRMEQVHRSNAARLKEIISLYGWPGTEAAWRIAQHAIGEPEFQRRVLVLLEEGVRAGRVPAWQAAHLEDRIRAFEGRPQLYGTQLDWTDRGVLDVYPEVEQPETVDERRRAVGLAPLEEVRRARAAEAAVDEPVPRDLARRRREMHEWAVRVGWRSTR